MEIHCFTNITSSSLVYSLHTLQKWSLLLFCFFLWLQFSIQCIQNQSKCVDGVTLSFIWRWPRCFGHFPQFLLLFPPLYISEALPILLHLCIFALTESQSLRELEGQSQSQNKWKHQITTGTKCYINKHLYYRRSWYSCIRKCSDSQKSIQRILLR